MTSLRCSDIKMKLFAINFLLVLHFGSNFARLAPVLSACSRNDPNFDRCVKEVVERIRPNIAVGDYGEGQPQAPFLEPISIDRMEIDRGSAFRAKLTNVTVKGAGDFSMRRVKLNLDEKMFNVSVKLPSMFVKGKYMLNMQILVLRISGKGVFDLILNNTTCNMRMKYYLKQAEDGKEYVQFYPIQVKLRFDKGKFRLENLFNGDPALGEIGNNAINQDPHVLLDEVKPVFEESLGKIFTEMANSAVHGATESEILPA